LSLGDEDNVAEPTGIYFDQDGRASVSTQKTPYASRGRHVNFRDTVTGVLLNLDTKSPNANTISLFKNGVRASEPIPLPESLCGKTLFPHVTFKNLTLQVQFGPSVAHALPFKCPTLQEAASADTVSAKAPATGKHEVIFPVGIPDEGTFEWLDSFLASNPQYVELSERKIIAWAKKKWLS
jgi:hypothetical protein